MTLSPGLATRAAEMGCFSSFSSHYLSIETVFPTHLPFSMVMCTPLRIYLDSEAKMFHFGSVLHFGFEIKCVMGRQCRVIFYLRVFSYICFTVLEMNALCVSSLPI